MAVCYGIPRNEKQVYMYVCNHRNKAQAVFFLDGECGLVVDFLAPMSLCVQSPTPHKAAHGGAYIILAPRR